MALAARSGSPPPRRGLAPQWVRNLALFAWIPGVSVVVAGTLLFVVETLKA